MSDPTLPPSTPVTDESPTPELITEDDPRVFIIERYEDWADYPSWMELEVDDLEETPRFATVAEARAWLDVYLDQQDADSLQWWYEAEARAQRAREVYAKRVAVLEQAGLAQDATDWQNGPLHKPREQAKKPKGVDRKNYRVALDDAKCPTCGVHSSDAKQLASTAHTDGAS